MMLVQAVSHVKALFKVTVISGLCHDGGMSGETCQGTIQGDNTQRVVP